MMSARSLVGSFLSPGAKAKYFTLRSVLDFIKTGGTIAPRECNICGYKGPFYPFGYNLRRDAACPNCHSLERHRLFKLFFDTHRQYFDGKAILHFAPEASVLRFAKPVAKSYLTADLFDMRADVKINIEDIGRSDEFDTVIASHVLEHVDDHKALCSIHHALKSGGTLLAMVPLTENLTTFEDNSITDRKERELYFGQYDHVRCYGGDFVDRVKAAGFSLRRFHPNEPSIPRFSLYRGETVFVCERI